MEHRIICPSCGAEIGEGEAKCPYCGTIHIPEAERQYMGKLYEMKETLEQLPEQTLEYQKKKTASSIKKLLIALVIGFCVVLSIWSFFIWKEKQDRKQFQERYERNQAWMEEYGPMLDKWYENEEFDRILEFSARPENWEMGLSLWSHGTFMTYYEAYSQCLFWYDAAESGEMMDAGNLASCLFSAIKLLYTYQEEPELEDEEDSIYAQYGLTAKEREYIVEYGKTAEKLLYQVLGISPQEVEHFYETAERTYGVIPWEEYERFGKELEKQRKAEGR